MFDFGPKNSPQVEKARLSDSEGMAAVEQVWDRRRLGENAMAQTGALNTLLGASRIKELINDPSAICLVARQADDIRGFLVAYHKQLALKVYPGLPNEFLGNENVWRGNFVYLKTIAVKPEIRGKGFGSKLIYELRSAALAADCRCIIGEIAVAPLENRSSIQLLRATLGATEIGRHTSASSGITWGLFKSEL